LSVKVRIPAQLRQLTGGEGLVECTPGPVADIIEELEGRHNGLAERLLENGELRRFINIYIDGEDIRFEQGLATEAPDGSEISVVPAVAGGQEPR
jgi:molybdopterin converting factor small subunit